MHQTKKFLFLTNLVKLQVKISIFGFQPFLADAGRSLFLTWTKELGSLSPSSLLQRSPGGRAVLLRGCGSCLTHDIASRLGILRNAPCSQQRSSQRYSRFVFRKKFL